MKTYTIEEIRKYLVNCDKIASVGVALGYLDEKNIDKANEPQEASKYEDEERIHPDDWDLLG
jgi:hypothetical protein